MAAAASPSRRNSAFICAIALVAATGAASADRQITPAQVVTSTLRGAALTELSTFALELARARVPAGLVIRETPSPSSPNRIVHGRSVGGRITMKDVLAALEEAHGDYEASITDGVVAVRPLGGSLCSAVLVTQLGPIQLSGGLRDVLTQLIRAARPDAKIGGGDVGSILSRPDSPPILPGQPLVTVKIGRSTFEQSLNRTIQNVAGSVWLLEEQRLATGNLACNLRVLREDGSNLIFAIDLAR